jgi:hypothetical protein
LAAVAAGTACRFAAQALPLGLTLGLGAGVAVLVLVTTGELRVADLRRLPRWTLGTASLGEVES